MKNSSLWAARAIASTRTAPSSSAGRYTAGQNRLPNDVVTHVRGRSGKNSVKCSSRGGSRSNAAESAQ